jgi:DNA polymerase III subunit epsilon
VLPGSDPRGHLHLGRYGKLFAVFPVICSTNRSLANAAPNEAEQKGVFASKPKYSAGGADMAIQPIQVRRDLKPDHRTGLACIVDVETTGLSSTDEAIELGMVLFAFDRANGTVLGVVDEHVGLREPTVPISRSAMRVHGITPEQVRGQRLDYDRVESILTQTEFLIAHNAGFDRRFVSRLSDTAAEKPWLCSMAGIDWLGKGCPSRRLQDLMAFYRITRPHAHRALDDVYGVLYLLASGTRRRPFMAELLGLE